MSQTEFANSVGVSRNTISCIETGPFCPAAKLALIIAIALDKKFEEVFYFDQKIRKFLWKTSNLYGIR